MHAALHNDSKSDSRALAGLDTCPASKQAPETFTLEGGACATL